MWSIYRKEESPVEGTELHDMLQRFPQAGTHNSNNYIFVGCHPEASDPIVVSELTDSEGERLTGDELVLALAVEMLKDARRPIHLTKGEASALHKHPLWRLWCGTYGEERELFKADWQYVEAMMPGWPAYTATLTYEDAKTTLKPL